MSFYIVPAMSYQTQQKMKKNKDDKKKRKKKHHDQKSPSSSTNASEKTESIYEEVPEITTTTTTTEPADAPELNSEELTKKLHKLKHTSSSGSLSSSIAAKFTTSSTPDKKDDHLDLRHSSTSTNTSGLSRHRVRRNSALSAHSSKNDHPDDAEETSRLFKPSFTMAQDQVREFVTVRELQHMNSLEAMKKALFTPSFQVFRFNNFLDILCGQHSNDPVNFASIRHNSICKFIQRYKLFIGVRHTTTVNTTDDRDIEGLLAYDLLQCRGFLRKLINLQSRSDKSRTPILWSEELLELNFTNYIRFIIDMPMSVLQIPKENLDEVQATHIHFKALFTDLQKEVHVLKKEETGDDLSSTTSSVAYLLQLITKVSYDFILLEKYHINILTKLSGNSLIESRVVSRFYEQFARRQANGDNESVKVLVYNTYFSVQYSWYLAITIPFLRVVEMSSYAEDSSLVKDTEVYRKHQEQTPKISLREQDPKLYDEYFSKLKLESFAKFKNMSDLQFVTTHKEIEEQNGNVMEFNCHKPRNFEFSSLSLARIPDESFEIVHSRDLVIELNLDNYRTILREFYRVLKKGGVFESPLILSGLGNIKSLETSQTIGFPQFSTLIKMKATDHFNTISNFYELVLTELVHIFGENNVKYSVVLLNTLSEVNSFLVKDIALRLAEISGKIDEYCKQFVVHEEGKVDPDIHLYMPIRAEKV